MKEANEKKYMVVEYASICDGGCLIPCHVPYKGYCQIKHLHLGYEALYSLELHAQ
jgi:hypothetical protein